MAAAWLACQNSSLRHLFLIGLGTLPATRFVNISAGNFQLPLPLSKLPLKRIGLALLPRALVNRLRHVGGLLLVGCQSGVIGNHSNPPQQTRFQASFVLTSQTGTKKPPPLVVPIGGHHFRRLASPNGLLFLPPRFYFSVFVSFL